MPKDLSREEEILVTSLFYCFRVRHALPKSESEFSQIVQGLSIAAFVIDDNHRITHCNRAFENLTGIAASACRNPQPVEDFLFFAKANPRRSHRGPCFRGGDRPLLCWQISQISGD